MTSGPSLLPGTDGEGQGASLPCPHHQLTDEGWDQISIAHVWGQFTHIPVNMFSSTVLPRRSVGSAFLSDAADKGEGQLQVAGSMGRRPFSPHSLHRMTEGAVWSAISFSHPLHQLTHASTNRVSSSVLPRQGEEPSFLSVAAGKWEGQLPHLSQALRVKR